MRMLKESPPLIPIPKEPPFIKIIKNHVHLQLTLNTPYRQLLFFGKIKRYTYNFNDKIIIEKCIYNISVGGKLVWK
jgi:hypothetical protein